VLGKKMTTTVRSISSSTTSIVGNMAKNVKGGHPVSKAIAHVWIHITAMMGASTSNTISIIAENAIINVLPRSMGRRSAFLEHAVFRATQDTPIAMALVWMNKPIQTIAVHVVLYVHPDKVAQMACVYALLDKRYAMEHASILKQTLIIVARATPNVHPDKVA
jgi:hypothetical protein